MLQLSICHTCSVVPALFIWHLLVVALVCTPCFGLNGLYFIPRGSEQPLVPEFGSPAQQSWDWCAALSG